MERPNTDSLVAEDVSKTYRGGFFGRDRIPALKGVTLRVPRGKIFGLLGPNGAGKTTLINVFAGQLQADSGRVCVLGNDFSSFRLPQFQALKARMNMCSGAPNFPWSFTVFEILNFYAMLYGMPGRRRREKIDEYITLFDLGKYTGQQFDSLSTGTKQKVALAKSLLNEPEILFLDEPTIGLDPDIAIKIREVIRVINAKWRNTIMLSTHYMREADELCDRIAFIRGGSIVAEGTSAELKQKTGAGDLEGVFLELSH
jgi:ABC-2 type transport system ATP-binding protein